MNIETNNSINNNEPRTRHRQRFVGQATDHGPDIAKASSGKQFKKDFGMKTSQVRSIFAASIFSVIIGFALSSIAAPILLGGFHGENETAQQSPDAAGLVSVTLARTGPSADITQGFSQLDNITWGSAALDVSPNDSANPANHAIVQAGVVDADDNPLPFTLILTVTNTGAKEVSLSQIHYDVKKDIANVGPNAGSLTYTSGDLADPDDTSSPFLIPNGNTANDIALSIFLADTILLAGESATFTWAHGPAEDPTGNTSLRLDNFAISGEVLVPEPSTAILAGLGLAGLCLRRRRR